MRWMAVTMMLLLIAIAGGVETPLAMGQFFEFENVNLNKAAPDFTLKTLDGKDVNMTKFREGKSAIIFFWATWCPHCREALKKLNEQRVDLENKGIKVLPVDLGENPAEVKDYVKRYKVGYEVFLDMDSVLAESYGLIGVPTLFFVDKDGIVKGVEHELPENFEEILGVGKGLSQNAAAGQ